MQPEAGPRREQGLACTLFRGIPAAASLKPFRDFVFGEAIAGIIRGIRAAASLKPRDRERGPLRGLDIRGIRAAASLKLVHAQGTREDRVDHPRHSCRGLIEAA